MFLDSDVYRAFSYLTSRGRARNGELVKQVEQRRIVGTCSGAREIPGADPKRRVAKLETKGDACGSNGGKAVRVGASGSDYSSLGGWKTTAF